jgi:hypothetical protein
MSPPHVEPEMWNLKPGILALVLMLTALLGGTCAHAAAPAAGTYDAVTAGHSGKCLDVSGASTADGALVQQQTCTSVTSQAWALNPLPAPLWT